MDETNLKQQQQSKKGMILIPKKLKQKEANFKWLLISS
jgi:hypothetical protein